MERSLKASDSVVKRTVIGPIAIGFVLGFLLVGAGRLQPDRSAPALAESGAAHAIAGDTTIRLPTNARASAPRRIIHPLF